MNESKTYRRNTVVSSVSQLSPNNSGVQFVDNRPSKFAGMISNSGFVDNRPKTGLPIQRKIYFLADGKEIGRPTSKKEGIAYNGVKKQLLEAPFVCSRRIFFEQNRLVPKNDFDKAIKNDLESTDKTLLVNKDGSVLTGTSFVINATNKLGPNPDNFKIDKPAPGDIKIEMVGYRNTYKTLPLNFGKKKPGYVANIVSYYTENGVKDITKRYFDDAISDGDEEKANRLGVVVGLNSFSPVIKDDYETRKKDVSEKLAELVLPRYPVNFQGFGFLWEPCWKLNNKHVPNFNIRWALENTPDVDNRNENFRMKQKELFANLPYGVFRETVMTNSGTHFLVDRLKIYNNPVYIHSGDGDSVSLKVPNDTDTDTGTTGILDKMDEHLGTSGTGAKIVIGGYNLYNLNEQKLIVEIVKTESRITVYADGSGIDKKKPSGDLSRYSKDDAAFIQAKIGQIVHNTQVGNRYDRIIRDAISEIYPKMLYPTEPNMLIKAYDSADNTDFFQTSFFDEKHRLKQQGSLWGMGASEGRVFKENMEKEYGQEPDASGIGFVDWAKGASLPTDPRGFDRHILISGYEKYPENIKDFSPTQTHATDRSGQDIPLVEAAVQQAQSYASAYRLAELYAQTLTSERKRKEEIRDNVLPVFNTVENMVSLMMMGSVNLEQLVKLADKNTGQELPDRIAKAIRNKLLEKFKFYNGIPDSGNDCNI